MTWQDIGGAMGIIATFVTIYIALRKWPHETHGIDASAVELYEKAQASALERTIKMDERTTHLENKVEELTCEVEELKGSVASLEQENSDLREWAERLVHQVQSLGQEPVKMRKRAAVKNE